ncbi:YoaK family protein [Bosea sp. (in: a-proteobacteria)]|uniref:YoaK family protein n=1 Tax=Bosea sp. (in: a-proteobacteria) TaxID=1871050 RepID=UPI00273520EA|nr:YoaK family protein [Bosea sp. (in: a-proteobacteria)]MDP3410620.1 YoaK family protein [Bosea sp. (in: a-proteobacteria)]
MMTYNRWAIGLAFCLSGLAGYIDTIGFISLGGFFVSFMSGNTTRLSIELAGLHTGGIATAATVLALFVGGVICGSLVGHFGGRRRKSAVLGLVAAALALAATLDMIGLSFAGAVLLAFAMGAENGVFQRDGEVTIALTYMTGTLVKMGQRMAGAMLGGPALGWVRHLVLWLGLLTGCINGAIAHYLVGQGAVWLAALAAAIFALALPFLPLDD